MEWTNKSIAKLLRDVAAAYQVKGEDRFKIVAYEKAADSIEQLARELGEVWRSNKLEEIPGVGKSLASSLDELFRTGKVEHFEKIKEDLPEAMFELLPIPGIGAKTAYRLSKELGLSKIKTAILDIEKAAFEGKIRVIEGFGEESEKDILRGIREFKNRGQRILLPEAYQVSQDILCWLKQSKAVIKADPLGSLRRMVPTIGDIDIAVATNSPQEVISHFTRYPRKARIIEAGEAKASILMKNGYEIDLMVQPVGSYGALLQHFTGSKQHNIALREFALKKDLSLSEYGIKPIKAIQNAKFSPREAGKMQNYNSKLKIFQFSQEEEFYNFLSLSWIPPELREDTGEIEAASQSGPEKTLKLPELVEMKDIKGDLHLHSSFLIETSHDEGKSSMETFLNKAQELNYEYIAFTEHNPSVSQHTKSEVIEILKRKMKLVGDINYSSEKQIKSRVNNLPVYVFNGLEVDIQPNGELAIPTEGFEFLDFVTASIHSSFKMGREAMTRRILKALSYPKVRILGHPTGRKLTKREPVEADWGKIFEFCRENNKWLEINAWPERLDLPDNLVREAVKGGVKLVINTDSHAVDQMNLMYYGVSVARRGWAEKKDIVNTMSYNEFRRLLNNEVN